MRIVAINNLPNLLCQCRTAYSAKDSHLELLYTLWHLIIQKIPKVSTPSYYRRTRRRNVRVNSVCQMIDVPLQGQLKTVQLHFRLRNATQSRGLDTFSSILRSDKSQFKINCGACLQLHLSLCYLRTGVLFEKGHLEETVHLFFVVSAQAFNSFKVSFNEVSVERSELMILPQKITEI